MRNIKYIVIHCTATPPLTPVVNIQNFWRTEKHWKNPGYHYILLADGTIQQLLDEKLIANGVEDYNKVCIHIGYIGGIDKNKKPQDTRTLSQKAAMYYIVSILRKKYPAAVIQGHRDFPGVHKACPSFNVKDWLKEFIP
jgi:N-acetylmuramoyl-L-alanine amidase